MAKLNKWDSLHLRNIAALERMIDEIFNSAVREAASIGVSVGNIKPDTLFSFDDYPVVKGRIDKMLQGLNDKLQVAIVNGVRSGWTLSNNKNNELCRQVFGNNVGKMPKSAYSHYFSNNDGARKAFEQRVVNGMSLSDRVWNYTTGFKKEIELGLDVGIRNGVSAVEMTKDLRQYLKYPDKLFRRVRDEHGVLQLSKAAKEFNPGRGVYRSSYKNARRLAATETNMAYRTSDYMRWQQMDFVVGIEIRLSNNHPVSDICDELKGRYPKDFKFVGWHPHCRCHAVSILKTPEEMEEDNKRIMNGEDTVCESENKVTEPPKGFTAWMSENSFRIDEARKNDTLPYFLKDNESQSWLKTAITSRFTDEYVSQFPKAALFVNKPEQIVERMRDNPFNRIDVLELDEDIRTIMKKYSFDTYDISGSMKVNESGTVLLEWSDNMNKFNLSRKFFIDEQGRKVVDHHLFELHKDLQGKGISKQIFRALYKQYRTAGVERIEVFANIDVGGYTWARYGFCVKDRNSAISAIRFSELTNKQETRIMSIIDEHFKSFSSPFPMDKIARLPYGKKALLGSDWEGVLDLTDPVQRRKFEKYLRR